jgi:glycosyltransferase involved in cell wall biosynthesis
MTIFHIITSFQVGGAEDVALSICKYCRANHKNARIILFELYAWDNSYATNMKMRAKEAGIEYFTLGFVNKKYLSLLIAPFRLLYHILSKKPAVIHSHTDLPDFVLAASLKLFLFKKQFKIVRTIQNTELWSTHYKLGKFTETSFKNDHIVSVSDPTTDAYHLLRKRYNLIPSQNQYFIPNGIPNREPEPYLFQLQKNKFNIAFIGRFENQKGIDILIEAIKNLPADLNTKFSFHFIGNGSYEKQVKELCAEKDNCFEYGIIPLVANKIHVFDYIIMPSRHEGFVLVSLLASMSKVPVIAADVPGLSETLPQDWPLLIKSADSNAYIQMLKRIDASEFDIPALKIRAFDFVEKNYSIKKMGDAYLELYRNIVLKDS